MAMLNNQMVHIIYIYTLTIIWKTLSDIWEQWDEAVEDPS